jgi:hypothetical protein
LVGAGVYEVRRNKNTTISFMKSTFIIPSLFLFLCSCSHKQATSNHPAIDLVQAGKEVTWDEGWVSHVTKRDGSSLEGIRITTMWRGKPIAYEADKGTISGGFSPDGRDPFVKIVLIDALCPTTNGVNRQVRGPEIVFIFHKKLTPSKVTSTRQSASLTSEQAKTVALRLANEKASTLYHCQPFADGQPAQIVAGHWLWDARQGFGHGDIMATVELASDGSTNSVDLQLLDSQNLL